MSKIDKLTDEQEVLLNKYRDDWLAIGLNTDPVDHDTVRRTVRDLYVHSGLKAPGTVMILRSPLECLKVRHEMVRNSGGEDTEVFQGTIFWGSHEAFWVSMYKFCEAIGVNYGEKLQKRLDAYAEYVKNCGWAYFYEDVALVSDRPRKLAFDQQRRLHCSNGPAIEYSDGLSVYAWHGLRVSQSIIEGGFSAEEIEEESNSEVRRVLLEREYNGRTGFDLYLETRRAKTISSDTLHGQVRKLLELNISGEKVRIVEVINGSEDADGSRRKYHIGVVRNQSGTLPGNPAEAIAASYGISYAAYKEDVRS